MSQTVLYQIAAVVLLVGARLVTAGNLLAPQGGARAAVASGIYYPVALAVLLGGLLVMAGMPALYLRQRAESGVLGFAGMVSMLAAGMPPNRGLPTGPDSGLPLDRNHECLQQDPQRRACSVHHLLRGR